MVETFTWCPAAGGGASRTRMPRLTELKYGDGYTHRTTTGINIMQDSWALNFVGDQTYLGAIDNFLGANSVVGFWWAVPGGAATILVTCDQWTLTWSDRGSDLLLLGSLSATFVRQYNMQPGGPQP